MLAFHMFCHPDIDAAGAIARDPLDRYLKSLVDAASWWTSGASTRDYPGYDQLVTGLSQEDFHSMVAKGAAWVGTPDQLVSQIHDYAAGVGGFEIASLQVNFNTISLVDAENSMRLFSAEVMPRINV